MASDRIMRDDNDSKTEHIHQFSVVFVARNVDRSFNYEPNQKLNIYLRDYQKKGAALSLCARETLCTDRQYVIMI